MEKPSVALLLSIDETYRKEPILLLPENHRPRRQLRIIPPGCHPAHRTRRLGICIFLQYGTSARIEPHLRLGGHLLQPRRR